MSPPARGRNDPGTIPNERLQRSSALPSPPVCKRTGKRAQSNTQHYTPTPDMSHASTQPTQREEEPLSASRLRPCALCRLGSTAANAARALSALCARTSALRSAAGLARLGLRCLGPRAHVALCVLVRPLSQQRLHHGNLPINRRIVKRSPSVLRRATGRVGSDFNSECMVRAQ
jgi:hypothetical protein